jgi:hypothetical protein
MNEKILSKISINGDWGLGPIPNPQSPFNFTYLSKKL